MHTFQICGTLKMFTEILIDMQYILIYIQYYTRPRLFIYTYSLKVLRQLHSEKCLENCLSTTDTVTPICFPFTTNILLKHHTNSQLSHDYFGW